MTRSPSRPGRRPRPGLVVHHSARALAADVIGRVLEDGAWAQPTLASALASSPLDGRDKAFATELTYGALRWASSLEQSLLRSADRPGRGLDKRMRPHLLVAAYQLQHLGERVPAHAAVSEAVNAVRRVRPGLDGFANALLRRLGSPPHLLLKPGAALHEVADALGVPRLLAHAVCKDLPPDDVMPALMALNGRPTTWAMSFGDASAVAAPQPALHRFVPGMFALDGGAVAEQAGYLEGSFLVMDPSSAAAALLVDARPGQRVLDLCAAPGGKTALLARAVRHGDSTLGRVTAVELQERRAARIRDNAARLKLADAVEVCIGDVRTLVLDPADAVLLDAPCTGLGTTRRKPEIKLRRTEADVAENAALQRALVERAVSLVKPGGVLVYSVCSPIPEEGAAQIEHILTAHPEFVVEAPRAALPWLPAHAVDARGCVRLLPHRDDADAFFCARLRRRTAP